MKRLIATALIAGGAVLSAQSAPVRWESTGGPLIGELENVLLPAGQIVLVGQQSGWFRSADRGATWQRPAGIRPWVTIGGGPMLFGVDSDVVRRSADAGGTFTACRALPVSAGSVVTSIGAQDRQIYASVGGVGLFRSVDACDSWAAIRTPWPFDFPPQISHVDGTRIIVRATGGWFLSDNAGASWTLLGEPTDAVNAFASGCRGELISAGGNGVLTSRDAGRSWSSAGLNDRAVMAIVSRSCDEWFAAVENVDRGTYTMFRTRDRGARWTDASEGLGGHHVVTLRSDGRDVYLAGVAGAYQWTDTAGWRQIGPAGQTLRSLAVSPTGELVGVGDSAWRFRAGRWRVRLLTSNGRRLLNVTNLKFLPGGEMLVFTHDGVYRSSDDGETWQRAGLQRPVSSFTVTPAGTLLAGTNDGVFRSTDGGVTWNERSIGLTDFQVSALAAGADGVVYAGTRKGTVYQLGDDDRWRPLAQRSLTYPVDALLLHRSGALLAGANFGVARWDPARRFWQLPSRAAAGQPTEVRTLTLDATGRVFAGTAKNGVFVSSNAGQSWLPANDGLPALNILAATASPDGQVFVSTVEGVFRVRQ